VDGERAALLQATGRYSEALALRERLAQEDPGIDTLGGLASLLGEMGQWAAAESCWQAALEADTGVSPLPAGQLLFEWGVSAMHRGELELAEARLGELDAILPQHVPGRGHRAEVALARGRLDLALALVAPLVDASEILVARGDHEAAEQAEQAAAAYELLLARRPEAYADHAAAFFLGVGARPERAVDLALLNWNLRDTPRSRRLLARAREATTVRREKVA
jgi:tetratricopeptide (TPR) repeat protein